MPSSLALRPGQAKPSLRLPVMLLSLLLIACPADAAPALSKPVKPAPAKQASEKSQDKAPQSKPQAAEIPLENVVAVKLDDLVNKPQEFVGKNVRFQAKFFAFSNLALDYKPAYRPSKTHLSLLVLKPETHIPLSEVKLAMMIPKEKDPESQLLTTLKDGDQLEIIGKVFSAALDEPWVEIFKLKKLGGAVEAKKASADVSKPEPGKESKTESAETNTQPQQHKDQK